MEVEACMYAFNYVQILKQHTLLFMFLGELNLYPHNLEITQLFNYQQSHITLANDN
jgi:hypothetical protein